ncbi:hypothetical protein [uncultured Mucilaginibacter sp.]|uniref:hypothetical protein n=1 Tax=uncultured Mucilaginibacter sp. TaxID=797541 RepID=UPI0026295EAE|nr:hypothetical protein [uncultured Mucilaginibacter sp.]
MVLFENVFVKKKNNPSWFVLVLFLSCLIFACKRSINQQSHRDYDPILVRTLNKLEQKYADKKVRVNTWNNKAGAYQDIAILDAEELPTKRILTIGDSVQLIGIDLNHTTGILAKIKYSNNQTGYIPYNYVEEFEPAALVDPDLKD